MDAKDLQGIELFQALSSHDLERIGRWTDEVELAEGARLVNRGDLPHEFFVLLEGAVEVRRGEDLVATLGPGDFFGEIAILEDERRTASVVAASPVRVAVMTTRDFDEMRAEMPAVAAKIQQAAIQRMPPAR